MEFKKATHVEWIPFAVVTLVIKEMIMTQQTPLVAVSTGIILKQKVLVPLVAL